VLLKKGTDINAFNEKLAGFVKSKNADQKKFYLHSVFQTPIYIITIIMECHPEAG
jgi:hypothetical protein